MTVQVEEFEHKQKELEQVASPIMTKMYQGDANGGGGMPGGGMPGSGMPGGGMPGGTGGGPTVEEVD